MVRPVIALLTDFGLRDHYVAAMKAVMLAIAPDATFVDITHDIPPQDVLAASLELAACYRYFPADTVFLVVVDPGVGTSRRPIALRTGKYAFVAPDNGVLAPVIAQEAAPPVVVELQAPRYARPEISRTFEGRDRFAPAAAWLAAGIDLREFGPIVATLQPLEMPEPRRSRRAIAGEIVKVDRFGNLVSNIDRGLVNRLAQQGTPIVSIGSHRVGAIVATYGDAPPGEVCALVGSGGYVEIAAHGASAARLLGLGRGARIVIAADQDAIEEIDRSGS